MTADPKNSLEWNDLSLLLEIGRTESLAGAARSLGQNHSTIFRRINAIEERTKVRFFDRFAHGYVPTEAGRAAMQAAERIESEVLALGREVLGRDLALRGRIRLTCPEAMAEEMSPGFANEFRTLHPEIQIDVSPGHAAMDLNRREAEVAIRATSRPPENAFGKALCAFRFDFYATPDYAAKAAHREPADHDLLLIESTAGWLVPHLFRNADEAVRATVFQCRASRAVQNACALGMGLAYLPCYIGDSDARLVKIAKGPEARTLKLWVITHQDLQHTARIRALMSYLYEALGSRADLFSGDRKPVWTAPDPQSRA